MKSLHQTQLLIIISIKNKLKKLSYMKVTMISMVDGVIGTVIKGLVKGLEGLDKMQQNSKCRQCGDRNETINPIISECSKLALKKHKTGLDWVGKVIHWEMCKKFKFDHTNKWYMHNAASVLENDTHKLL